MVLSAFTPESAASLDVAPDQGLCPVRALRVYIGWMDFAEYLRQILQFGHVVISLPGLVGEYDPWFYLLSLAV